MRRGCSRCWVLAGLCALALPTGSATAVTLFYETFDGYSANDPGIPEISEGANEFWYGGRFERFDNGTIDQDLAILGSGGGGNSTPVARVEDEAGLLFQIPSGYVGVVLELDWRTSSVSGSDRLVIGYHVGDDLGFDQGPNRFRDFFTDDFGGDEAAATAWWSTEWTELMRGASDTFQHLVAPLPPSQVIWVAMWLDNGEGDFGRIDNVRVEAVPEPVPEPSGLLLLAAGVGSLTAARRRLRRPGA